MKPTIADEIGQLDSNHLPSVEGLVLVDRRTKQNLVVETRMARHFHRHSMAEEKRIG